MAGPVLLLAVITSKQHTPNRSFKERINSIVEPAIRAEMDEKKQPFGCF